MRYPYIKYCRNIDIKPIFKGITGMPLVLDMSDGSDLYEKVDVNDQRAFQALLDSMMKDRYSWGVSSYLENRSHALSQYPQMVEEKRFYHLGMDIIVPVDTPLHSPLKSVVEDSGYEEGPGNYGGYVLLRHDSDVFETFYSFYGHLNKTRLPSVKTELDAGEVFALIGDYPENGNWFFHTHLQIITRKGLDEGYISKGYCSAQDLADMNTICPSPIPLFKT